MNEAAKSRPSLLSVALFLIVAGTIGAALLLPYQVQLQLASGAERPAWTLQVPVWALYVLSTAIKVIPLVLLVPAGIWAARRLDFGMPLIETLIARKPMPSGTLRDLITAALAGLLGGGLIIGLDLGAFAHALPQAAISPGSNPPAWTGFLASFYGGINEELMSRLFFLSFLALGLRAVALTFGASRSQALPSGIFWAANILAALLFGAGHLPAAAMLTPLTAQLVMRTFVLNGLLAILFGWLYKRNGLEAAMVSHFCADLVLHVAAPLLSSPA